MNIDSTPSIRRDVRHYLSQMDSVEKRTRTNQALDHFIHSALFRRARHIGLFFPVRHELDILPLFNICQTMNKAIYLPCLMPRPSHKLYFLPYRDGDTLTQNRFQIPEPDHGIHKRISLMRMDVVVTPLVAFGDQGQRLGMGGGFYDRTFAFRLQRHQLKRPQLWSIALEGQRQTFTQNAWDVPIDGVSTETGNHVFR